MDLEKVISVDREVMSGTPVFAGTRVPVSSLFEHLKAGDSLDDFLEGFPTVTREQVERLLDLVQDMAQTEAKYARVA